MIIMENKYILVLNLKRKIVKNDKYFISLID